ncbi:MAG TPA: 50S ribosomal protein L17 [Bacteroidales bacterium]|nr:50S ribosomal protein L17 [Bacteroidales bacterium]HRX95755.1 50S ribosomal protein L17 [Bacteroidales bacterium]
MRHRKKINHLSRKSAHRKAMLANMATSLIMHKRIHTTLAKAKALKVYVEPLLTKAKEDSTHSRRIVFGYLQNKDAVTELFREISVKIADRPGGYTRIIKIGARLGDNAEMCMMELVDYNENLLSDKGGAQKSASRRRRRGGAAGAKKEEVAAPAATETKKESAPEKVEEPEAVAEEQVEVVAEAEVAEAPAEPEAVVEVEEPKVETPAEPEAKAEEPAAEAEEAREDGAEDKKDEATK